MNVWDHTTDSWGSIRDRYSGNKDELKKVIKTLLDTPYEELEKWDDRSLREWIHQYTDDQGVVDLFEFISVLECMTEHWWDHSASDNLFVRKMHYEEKRSAAYSFWPEQGWDGLFQDLADAVTENGGEIRLGESVHKVVIENHEVKGVAVARKPRILPNDYETEMIEADCVISTLPVWHVLQVVPEWELPDWYVGQIKYLAQDHYRIAWLGLYLAVDEPVPILDRLELSTWLHAPTARISGLLLRADGARPDDRARRASTSTSCGGIIPGAQRQGRALHQPEVRRVRARHRRHVPGPREADLAPPPPRLRAVVRGDPEAGPRRHVPAALAGARTSTASTSRARRSAAAASASTAPPAPA